MAEIEPPKPGLRVGVFHSLAEESLLLLGYGVYEGDEVPPPDIIIPGQGPVGAVGIAAPKIRLDDGTVVWGGECWWNTEEVVKGYEEGRTIIRPKLDSLRAKIREAWEKAVRGLEAEEERLP